MALYLLVTVECLWRHLVFSVLCTTGVFREGGVMCCKLSQSVHHITVGFVHCCFSSLCASLLFTVLVLVNYAVTWHHRLVSLFPSVNICCVFSVAGTRYYHVLCVGFAWCLSMWFTSYCFYLLHSSVWRYCLCWGGRQVV